MTAGAHVPGRAGRGSSPLLRGTSMRCFLCYRHSDSQIITGRIYDRLIDRFGRRAIVRDLNDIPLGADFREFAREVVGQCKAVLVVIGEDWLVARNSEGELRLNDPADPVRLEVEVALSAGVAVIPVLVSGVRMPRTSELPASMQELSYKTGVAIDGGLDFHHHVDRLIAGLMRLR